MRPVNLVPAEQRAGGAGGDPKVAYGIVGGLGVLLLMVLLAVSYSNKATTLQDEAAAIEAEAARRAVTVKPVQSFNDFADVVQARTLLVGGLAESRFPWDKALLNLARSMPEDVTLDTIAAATTTTAGGTATGDSVQDPSSASLDLTGCASGWYGASRFLVRLKDLPGVKDVTPGASDTESAAEDGSSEGGDAGGGRKANCGPAPLTFTYKVTYNPQKVDLVGLPKIGGAAPAGGASEATGAEPAAATSATGPQ
ncbi:MAG: hypothetical protein WAP37_05565 [Solirubrobacterales bacterium]